MHKNKISYISLTNSQGRTKITIAREGTEGLGRTHHARDHWFGANFSKEHGIVRARRMAALAARFIELDHGQ